MERGAGGQRHCGHHQYPVFAPLQSSRGPIPVQVPWEKYFRNLCGIHFVEIGASCGTDEPGCDNLGEPIWQYQKAFNWTGTVVEASPSAFDRLKANYAPYSRVTPMNVAISNKNSERLDFWCPAKVGSSSGTETGCTSIRELARRNRWLDNHFTVRAISLHELWQSLRPKFVDVLSVDVEGAEFGVLGRPLPSPLPRFIYFEMGCFFEKTQKGGPAKLELLRQRLAAQGYESVFQGQLINSKTMLQAMKIGRDDLWRLNLDARPAAVNLSDPIWRDPVPTTG